MFSIKRSVLISLICMAFLAVGTADAKRVKTESGSVDLNIHGMMPFSDVTLPDGMIGAGLSLYAEKRLMPIMGLGVNVGFSEYFADGDAMKAGFVELAGRLYPIKASRSGELYLQGGAGYNWPRTMDKSWPYAILGPEEVSGVKGRFHGTTGLGFKKFLSGNKYLNLGVNFDAYSPTKDNMELFNAGIKVGFGMRLGTLRTPGRGRKATTAKVVATPVAAAAVVTPVAVTVAATPVVVNAAATKVVADKLAAEKLAADQKAAAAKKAAADKVAAAKTVVVKPVATVKSTGAVAIDTGKAPTTPVSYTWKTGDNLPALAQAFYGDPNLYPVIVDANIAKLKMPASLKSGATIVVPRATSLTDAVKAQAIEKSSKIAYKVWAKIGAL